jgi:hypothetical protein
VDDFSGVEVFEGSQYLVNEELNVVDLQVLLGPNDTAHIGFHDIADQVNLANDLTFTWHVNNVLKSENIFMHAALHNNDLAQNTLSVNLKGSIY